MPCTILINISSVSRLILKTKIILNKQIIKQYLRYERLSSYHINFGNNDINKGRHIWAFLYLYHKHQNIIHIATITKKTKNHKQNKRNAGTRENNNAHGRMRPPGSVPETFVCNETHYSRTQNVLRNNSPYPAAVRISDELRKV